MHQQQRADVTPAFQHVQGRVPMPMAPQSLRMEHPMGGVPRHLLPAQRPTNMTPPPMQGVPAAGNGMSPRGAAMGLGRSQGMPPAPIIPMPHPTQMMGKSSPSPQESAGAAVASSGRGAACPTMRITHAVGRGGGAGPMMMMNSAGMSAMGTDPSRQGSPSSGFHAPAGQDRRVSWVLGARGAGGVVGGPPAHDNHPGVPGSASTLQNFPAPTNETLQKRQQQQPAARGPVVQPQSSPSSGKLEKAMNANSGGFWGNIKRSALGLLRLDSPAEVKQESPSDKRATSARSYSERRKQLERQQAAVHSVEPNHRVHQVSFTPRRIATPAPAPARVAATVPADTAASDRLLVSPTVHLRDEMGEAGVAPPSVIRRSKEGEESHQKSLLTQRMLRFPSLAIVDSDADSSGGSRENEKRNHQEEPKQDVVTRAPADGESSEQTPERQMCHLSPVSSASPKAASPMNTHLTELQQHGSTREDGHEVETASTQLPTASDISLQPPPSSSSSKNVMMIRKRSSLPELLASDKDAMAASRERPFATPICKSGKQALDATTARRAGGNKSKGGSASRGEVETDEQEVSGLPSDSRTSSALAHTLRPHVESEARRGKVTRADSLGRTRDESPHAVKVPTNAESAGHHREARRQRSLSSLAHHRLSRSSSSSSSAKMDRHDVKPKQRKHQHRGCREEQTALSRTASLLPDSPDGKSRTRHRPRQERGVTSARHASSRGGSPKRSGPKGKRAPLYSPDVDEISGVDRVSPRRCSASTPARTHDRRDRRRDTMRNGSSSSSPERRTLRSPLSSIFRTADVYQLYHELKRQQGELHRDRVSRWRQQREIPPPAGTTSGGSSSSGRGSTASVKSLPTRPRCSHSRKGKRALHVQEHSARPWRHNSLHPGPLVSATPLRRPLGCISLGDGRYWRVDRERRGSDGSLHASHSQAAHHASCRASPMWTNLTRPCESSSSSQACGQRNRSASLPLHPYEVVSFQQCPGGGEPRKCQKSFIENNYAVDGSVTRPQQQDHHHHHHRQHRSGGNTKEQNQKPQEEECNHRLLAPLLSPPRRPRRQRGAGEVKQDHVASPASATRATVNNTPTARHLRRCCSESAIAAQRPGAAFAPAARASSTTSWVDEVIAAAVDENPAGRAATFTRHNSRIPIPVIDLRTEFKPRLDAPLESRLPFGVSNSRVRCGVNYGGANNGLKNGTAAAGKRKGATRAASWSSRRCQTPEKRTATTRHEAESVAEAVNRQSPPKRVVNAPPFPPFKFYSSFEVKHPDRPSAWVMGPERRDLLANSPAARRRIVKKAASDGAARYAYDDDAAAASASSAPVLLVEEVRLDEQRRPYVLIREVPCGTAAVTAQRNSIERLSRPRPVFVRRTDELEVGK